MSYNFNSIRGDPHNTPIITADNIIFATTPFLKAHVKKSTNRTKRTIKEKLSSQVV